MLKMLEEATIRTTGLDVIGVGRRFLVSEDVRTEILDLARSESKAQNSHGELAKAL